MKNGGLTNFTMKNGSISGWWCLIILKNMSSSVGKDDIPYMKWKIKNFQTTNQIYIYIAMWGPPDKMVYKPHEDYSYRSLIKHSAIVKLEYSVHQLNAIPSSWAPPCIYALINFHITLENHHAM